VAEWWLTGGVNRPDTPAALGRQECLLLVLDVSNLVSLSRWSRRGAVRHQGAVDDDDSGGLGGAGRTGDCGAAVTDPHRQRGVLHCATFAEFDRDLAFTFAATRGDQAVARPGGRIGDPILELPNEPDAQGTTGRPARSDQHFGELGGLGGFATGLLRHGWHGLERTVYWHR
jgi:hypothetical protein